MLPAASWTKFKTPSIPGIRFTPATTPNSPTYGIWIVSGIFCKGRLTSPEAWRAADSSSNFRSRRNLKAPSRVTPIVPSWSATVAVASPPPNMFASPKLFASNPKLELKPNSYTPPNIGIALGMGTGDFTSKGGSGICIVCLRPYVTTLP